MFLRAAGAQLLKGLDPVTIPALVLVSNASSLPTNYSFYLQFHFCAIYYVRVTRVLEDGRGTAAEGP